MTSAASFFVREDKKPRVIVFVHGILGDPRETWTNTTTGKFFPELVKSDRTFDEADIFVYGFPSPKVSSAYSIDELTEHMRLQFQLKGILQNYREIVFVCHSMGGLITRAFLLKYREQITAKIPMIYFFATPSTGSALAGYARAFAKNPQYRDMVLLAGNSYLGSQQTSWLASSYARTVRSFCAYETLPTMGVQVVDRASATNLCTMRLDPIMANHLDIVKPRDAEDEPFGALKAAYMETFEGSGEQVEITNESLPNLLASLRSPTRRQSYVIRTPVDLSALTGAREQWYAMNFTFQDAGALYVGSRELALDIRGKFDAASDAVPVFASYSADRRTAASGGNGADGENGHAGAGYGEAGQNGKPATNGDAGVAGMPGGRVELSLRNAPARPFRVALYGQSGGHGGNGGRGGDGGRGADGEPAKSGLLGCEHGGGDGGRGGAGGRGGDAGAGGACGDAGEFVVSAPPELREELVTLIHADPTHAESGRPGSGGAGGNAGHGGEMGHGNGFCGGGHGGGDGSPGDKGNVPGAPPRVCSSTRVIVR